MSTATPVGEVVVGVDGSTDGWQAARFAADVARRRGTAVRVVNGYLGLIAGYAAFGMVDPLFGAETVLRESAEKTVREAAELLGEQYPDLTVHTSIVAGGPASALIDMSRDAAVTVVGSRGLGGFSGLLLGSVSTQVASHGHGPVVVVRPVQADQDEGPVLIGYDGSTAAVAALAFAAEEAASRKSRLVVLHVYWPAVGFGRDYDADAAEREATARAESLLAEAIQPHQQRYPELHIETRTIRHLNPEHCLVEESARAVLTVVGCRGRGGFASLLLGSTSSTLVHHASGPVAVIHPAADHPAPDA